MKTALLTSWQQLSSLEGEWNALLKSSRSDTLFLTWEWIQAWREVVGETQEPLVVTVRDSNQRLVGIAPFYRYRIQFLGCLNLKALRILADFATASEYPDWFVSPDCEDEALSAIAQALLQASDLWDVIWMPSVSGWSGALNRLSKALESAGLLYRSRATPFSSIPLPDSLQQFEAGFSSKRRQQMRRKRRNLMSRPGVKVIHCKNQDNLPGFIESLFDLHHRRRILLGDPGCFIRKPAEASFYKHFLPKALDNGWLRLAALIDNGTIEAIQIGYVYGGDFLQMQEGFNPSYISGSSNVLRHTIIEECIKEGLNSYDFLGGFSEHKRRWGAQIRHGHDLLIGRPSLKNWLLLNQDIWPTGRFIKEYGLFDGN